MTPAVRARQRRPRYRSAQALGGALIWMAASSVATFSAGAREPSDPEVASAPADAPAQASGPDVSPCPPGIAADARLGTIGTLFDAGQEEAATSCLDAALADYREDVASAGDPVAWVRLLARATIPKSTWLRAFRALHEKSETFPPGVTLPTLVEKINPEYPGVAERAEIEGKVIVGAVIDESGNVARLHVLNSTNPIFNEPAETAVAQWRFRPGLIDQAPVPVLYTIRVDFKRRD